MQNSQSYRMVVLDLRFGQVLMKIFNFKVKVSLIISATVIRIICNRDNNKEKGATTTVR